jgi:hypothetical protein
MAKWRTVRCELAVRCAGGCGRVRNGRERGASVAETDEGKGVKEWDTLQQRKEAARFANADGDRAAQ